MIRQLHHLSCACADCLYLLVIAADALVRDPDLEPEIDEDSDGQDFVMADGAITLPEYVRVGDIWRSDPDCDQDTSAEQWGEAIWLEADGSARPLA